LALHPSLHPPPRGFHVTGVEPDARLLARVRGITHTNSIPLRLCGPAQQRLAGGSADLVTVMHGLHLLEPTTSLAEIHRVLRDSGLLVAAWNDRWV
jgi:SAM-dependent methyltransferase